MATFMKLGRLLAGSGGMLVAGSAMLSSCVFTVQPGEMAIIFSQLSGIKEAVYKDGIHLKLPFIEYPIRYDVRSRPREIGTNSGTKDQQTVQIRLRILTRPIPEHIPRLYNEFGIDYDERILPGIGNEILKAVVAHFNAEELITRRQDVSKKITEKIGERIGRMGLVLDDVALIDLQFSSEYMYAVEMKQVEQQEAERRQYVVKINEIERDAAVKRAEGEAEAARLIGQATAKFGSALWELRKIEAMKDIARSLAKNGNVTFVPPNSSMLIGSMPALQKATPPPQPVLQKATDFFRGRGK